ncbi:Orotidine 5'-phosphate decarboxylase [Rosistilla oblonga]|nr:Orotidine 5'-phosphate decarboxylase [Rosistilla oblonga]
MMSDNAAFGDRLAQAVTDKKSVVCVGLDPRFEQLPSGLRDAAAASPQGRAAAFSQFCREIIDVVAPLVPVVKPQAAFFEQLGPHGTMALAETIEYAHRKGLMVILDGKRNDIGSTAAAYASAYLGAGDRSAWGSDALTVSPYLGADSIEPFVETCDSRQAGIFVLVKTSNPGGGLLQDRRGEDGSVYEAVANLVTQQNADRLGTSGYGPVGAVVGATYPEQLAELRQRMPSAWILIPGFGAQGGSAADVAAGFDDKGLGAIVNNSRHIIFAHARPEFKESFGDARWQEAVEAATRQMNEQLKR